MLTKVFNLFSCNYDKNCLRILDKLFFLYFTLLTSRVCCTYFFHIHSNFLNFLKFQLHYFPLIHIHFLIFFMFRILSNCFTYSLASSVFHTFLDYFTKKIELLLSSAMRSSRFLFIVIHSIHVVL
jgi:hypothetical protein